VEFSDKQRFAISTDGLRIRANQGHSIDVDLNLDEQSPPEILFLGTANFNLLSIRQQGLIKGSRQYVHLSQDIATAEAVAKRYGVPVVLTVYASRMSRDGYKFYLSQNGVWLTEVVPKDYITGFIKS
jgi:putative RNA 2'-phosphotransferase